MPKIRMKKEITLCGVTCFLDKDTGEYFTYIGGNLIRNKDTDKLAAEINRLQTYAICV